MRVLSISHRLPGMSFDNHSLFNAPTLFDYDAIVLGAGAVLDGIRAAARAEGEFATFADVPVVNGASIDGATGLAALLQRRRDEVQRALERGATVVVFAAPPSIVTNVSGFTGADTYFYLPAPEGMAWDASTIVAGEGNSAVVVDHGHPFVPVIEAYEREVLYRACFNERAPGFARHARVFLRSSGGAPIGVEFEVLNGRVIFMPTSRRPGEETYADDLARALLAGVEELGGIAGGTPPYWVDDLRVPGLSDRREAADRARAALDQAQAAFEAAEADLDALASVREVVWAAGDGAQLAATLACAEAIGFECGQTPEGDPVLLDGETEVHLVAAASAEAVGMSAHYRLRQRLDRVIEQRAVAPRGLVLANGQCDARPDERKREIDDALRVAAEATRYAVLSSRALFAATIAALEGASADTLAEVRRRLLTTDGVVALGDLFPAVAANEG